MGYCHAPGCNNPTKGSRLWCSKCNVKIGEGRLFKTLVKFDKILFNNKQFTLRKEFWKTFKPLFSDRFKEHLKQKGF